MIFKMTYVRIFVQELVFQANVTNDKGLYLPPTHTLGRGQSNLPKSYLKMSNLIPLMHFSKLILRNNYNEIVKSICFE